LEFHLSTSVFNLYDCGGEISPTETLYPYYHSLTTPLAFPYLTGSQGVKLVTQYPSGWTISSTVSSDLLSRATTAFPGSSSSLLGPSSSALSFPAGQASGVEGSVGIIVGGVVGGLALLCLTALVIIWILRGQPKAPRTAFASEAQPISPGFQSLAPGTCPPAFHSQIPELSSISRYELEAGAPKKLY
jgi:hypothetical protein